MNLLPRYVAMFIFASAEILLLFNIGINAERRKRYIGGRNADPGEQNWAVSIGLKDRSKIHFCGGSIIDTTYILTAAHCLELIFPNEVIVRSGTIDLRDKNAILTTVSRIIRHPGYSKPLLGNPYSPNDIAILKLNQNLVLGDRMSAIGLPTREPLEVPATFAGWGSVQFEPVVASPILQIATMKIISDRECEERQRTGRRPYYICAYDETGMSYRGDSGSALIVNGEIIGIAAARPQAIGAPSSFTNVYHYVDWIKKTVGIGNNV